MAKNKVIDIDVEFDDFELDENAIKKATQYKKSSDSHRGQKRTIEQKTNMSVWQKGVPKNTEHKEKIGDSMRGKTLEEIIGEEKAIKGRIARSEAQKGKKRDPKIAQKGVATRRANGNYDVNGMTGKEHKESTKSVMTIKAQIRQDLKRKLGLGKNDVVPKDLLLKAYKKAGL